MDRDNRHITRVIEPVDSRVRPRTGRRLKLPPRQALYYNDHPDAIVSDFDSSEYRAVLREIQRHLSEWEQQRTPAQTRWVEGNRRSTHLSTRAAAAAILHTLRS